MHIGRTLARTAQRHPGATALVAPAFGDHSRRELTYRELDSLVDRLDGGLAERGIGPGDAVGLFTDNCVEQVAAYVAVQRLGGVAVPVNHRLAGAELAAILDGADAAALLFDTERIDVVAAVRDRLSVDQLVCVDGPEGANDVPDWATPFSAVTDAEPPSEKPGADPEALALSMHTSGTTGTPKLVETTGRAQWANSLACVGEFGYRSLDVALNVAPLSHSAGYLNLLLPAIHVGATNVLLRGSFDPETMLRLVDSERATLTLGVPTHFQLLRRAVIDGDVDPAAYDLSSLRTVFTSGAPLAEDTAAWVADTLCPSLVNVYGLTETTGLLTVHRWSPDGDDDAGYAIGEPFLDVEIRLVRPEEDGREVGPHETVSPGERGHLVARAPKLMTGYRGRPEATAATLRDGWLFTGDVAVRRSDGTYALVDRLDNVIVTGGENVYPAEVERVLSDHPDVLDVAVVGEPDETFGERVAAYVVAERDSGGQLTVDDLTRYWRETRNAADFKRPRSIRFVDELPRNSSGKLQRDRIRDDERHSD
ncbi:class I adenylate-forming enzyme family protein [Halogeometricum luteum]|uniref:AMP-binding protein n=1 Tax=Halogeometricum luteum TaxID=2950537 RepID=A0ABU2G2B1_9EURY|nr:AMP-binding protein [Halogeometricum sp. S3BR5-2]MDS0294914.1 AMP-binding protein [Halogeometricum sp. S3BR5-2]